MKYRAPSCEGFHPEAIKWSGGKLKFEAYLVLCWYIFVVQQYCVFVVLNVKVLKVKLTILSTHPPTELM